ncbi:TetR family transcriptional regulator [Nonomuraea typhae]|uniref:TetR family transcriptional regulator n=1 Tax=Nonomuraea typhae TaxID=2603600 RepID=UPI0015E21CA6|nr:TetR family transcriptional regulator [Nonomuraea typhae]
MEARDRLVQAAQEALAADERVTIDSAARRAGISRSTAYRLFGSRTALLEELRIKAEPDTRQRILTAGMELLALTGLAELSMDDVAAKAGVSRANLYRLYPGKQALFQQLMRVESPLMVISGVLAEARTTPVEELMPELARGVAGVLHNRLGLIRLLVAEVSQISPESSEGVQFVFQEGVGKLMSYLENQMAGGHLRRMDPLLAAQSFVGPLLLHLLARPLTQERLGLSPEDAATQLAEQWLRGMRPG